MDSDVDVSRWVLELLVRDREKDCVAKRVLAVAPFSSQDWRLRKTVLIRTIECEVYDASVSETILETLEAIEDLDLSHGIATTDPMKAAYCAVATECTVKFLVAHMGKPGGKYLEAVDRIWRERVALLEGSDKSELVSAELMQRRDEVEAAVWDLSVSKKLSSMNTRNDALRLVAVYVKEALALMGPPFITWTVRLSMPKEVSDFEGDQVAAASENNVGFGSELEVQMANGANVGERSELEAQMENGANVGERSELEVQMENGAKVGDGSELEAQMANETNVGDGSEFEPQTENGDNVSDGSELEVQMTNETNVGDGSELEAQMGNGDNAGDKSELEVQTENGANVGAARELEGQMANETNASGFEPLSEANVGDGSELKAQMTNETNVGDGSESEAQMTNETNVDDGCELQAQMVNVANVSYGPELGPRVRLQEMGAGSSPPNANRGLCSSDLVEMDAGFTNRAEVSGDDQVCGEVNERALALPSVNRELSLSFKHATKDKEIQRTVGLRRKHLAFHRRSRGPVKIRDAEDLGTDVSDSKYDSVSTPEVSKVQEALKSSGLELQEVFTDPLPGFLHVAETVRSDLVMKSVNHVSRKDVGAANPSVENSTEPDQSNHDNLGNLSSSHQNDVPQPSGKENDAPNPSVDKGKGIEPVQTDDANLGNLSIHQNDVPQPSGKAPNPSVDKGKGTDPVQTDDSNLGNLSSSHQNDVSQRSGKENDAPIPSVDKGKGTDSFQTADANLRNPSSNVPLPSLMERNSTARSNEWDDPVDMSHEGIMKDASRLHLPSPKRHAVSPLNKYENNKLSKRRKVKRWSLWEEDTLRQAVQTYGKGNWKFILNHHRDIFEERTEVDLKDKWRNMTR